MSVSDTKTNGRLFVCCVYLFVFVCLSLTWSLTLTAQVRRVCRDTQKDRQRQQKMFLILAQIEIPRGRK